MSRTLEIARTALREQTEAAHTRVEALLGLGGGNVGPPKYLAALEAMAGVYGTIAAWLSGTQVPALATGLWERLGLHLTRLRGDVGFIRERLGASLVEGDLPRVAPPPAGWGEAHGFGMFYVIEGSTLGGQHIARHVGPLLGLDAARGMAFFAGDGAETGRLWRVYRQALAQHVTTEAQVSCAVAGARWAFAAVEAAWVQSAKAAGLPLPPSLPSHR